MHSKRVYSEIEASPVRRQFSSSRCVLLTFAAVSAVLRAGVSDGAVYYWDTNGATAGIGSVASPADWLSNSWAIGSTGTLATGAWPNTNPGNADEAAFTGTAGTVNIATDVYVNSLRYETANQTPNSVLASTGGTLNFSGVNPKLTVTLPATNDSVTITAPIRSSSGITLDGNSNSGGFKFLVLANTSAGTPNAFAGPLTIAAGGALRIGGGAAFEQIPDNVDLNVTGVIDFVTVGGASDMKQEKVRDVAVTGAAAIFSVGNGTDFVVNSIAGTNATNISVNGNQATVPGRLVINGWSDGSGDLTLHTSQLKLNTTSGQSAIGGRIVLSGDIASTGASQIINNNGGGATTPEIDDNTFTHKGFDWASAAHTIHVADNTLLVTSRAPSHPLQMTSLNAGGTTLTKTGAGVLLYEHAVQTSFFGTNRVAAGTLRIGASERLANNSTLDIVGGDFDLQTFTETVSAVVLDGGNVSGATGTLVAANGFELRSGSVAAKLGGAGDVLKSTAGSVQLTGANTYTGDTKVAAGTLALSQPVLANSADVYLTSGAFLNLGWGVGISDTIDALFFDGVPQAVGTWGAAGSGASFVSPLFTGTGMLLVSALGKAGDFDGNGVVNAADLAQWSGDVGLNADSDADGDGDSDGNDFLIWQRNVGIGAPGVLAGTTVAEPNSLAAALVVAGAAVGRPRRRSTRSRRRDAIA